MKEQEASHTTAPEAQIQQSLLSLRRSDQLQLRIPSFDTIPVSAIQRHSLTTEVTSDQYPGQKNAPQPSWDVVQLQPQEQLLEKHTAPLPYSKPGSQPDTEPLLPVSDGVFPQAMATHLRRSREKPAEVSLEEVPLLNSRDQYISELWRVERLSPEEEERVVAQARIGDQEAKNALIENCLWYVLHIAKRYAVYVEHDDLLDIVEVGNLAVTEKVDQALEIASRSVAAYLCGVAKQSIMQYCLYRSRLMPIKDNKSPISEFPQMTSLELLQEEAGNSDVLPEPEQSNQESDQEHLKRVREALSQLTAKQREVIEIRYGLGDTRAKTIRDIAERIGEDPKAISSRYTRALKRLRELLFLKENAQTG